MAGALRKTMVYLGLAEEEQRYEAYEGYEESEELGEQPRPEARSDRVERSSDHRAAVTPINRAVPRVVNGGGPVELSRIATIHPRTYNEAKVIGEAFRAGIPVIMNLGDMDDSDAKRLVDFAAGLVFGLHGAIERVTSKVFLLSPANVEVAPADKAHAPERTLFNQS